MLKEKVKEALAEKCHLRKGERVILAFSGGSDSVCLLDILSNLPYEIVVGYFNHNLRDDVNEEIQFAQDSAKKYKIKSEIGSARIAEIAAETGKGIEETAREFRYQFLSDIASKYKAKGIIVAHHADDQVETLLMNLIRGSGLNGLTGMKYVSSLKINREIPVLRPMLGIWKNEIHEYCQLNDLSFKEDYTNLDIKYTRNNLRQNIIPEIEKINPKFKENLIKTQLILEEDETTLVDLMEKTQSRIYLSDDKEFLKIDIPEFRKISNGLQRRIIKKGLETKFGIEKDITFLMIEDIRNVLNGGVRSKFSKITDQINVLLEDGIAYIYSNPEHLIDQDTLFLPDALDVIQIDIPGSTKVNDYWYINSSFIDLNTFQNREESFDHLYFAYFDYELLIDALRIRKWESGDRYAPMGMRGKSMKLSDFWINKKFPKRYRTHWPLVCDQEDIIWIPGFQPSSKAIVHSCTNQILKLYFSKEKS